MYKKTNKTVTHIVHIILFTYYITKFIVYLQTFPANFDPDTVVSNLLPAPEPALCLRLYPLTWSGSPSLRLEVIGCLHP